MSKSLPVTPSSGDQTSSTATVDGSEPEAPANVPSKSPARRIASLDWVRGWMLIASVGVNSLIGTPGWFDHAAWNSVHPLDLIFPVFVTLSGCGLAFAMHRKVKVAPLLRRVAVLFVVGLLYNAVVSNSWDVDTWRVTGVLQLYAVVVAALGLLHLVTRSWVGWAVITVAFAAAHTTLLSVYATGCPGGLLTPGCNPAGPIDVAVLGAEHVYRLGAAGHDPEGLVAIFGALISASAGATVGHLMLSLRRRAKRSSQRLDVAVVPMLVLAASFLLLAQLAISAPEWLGGVDTQVMKRLWTAPFALRLAALTTVALLVGHLLVDRERVPRLLEAASFPLYALGRNSLLVYFGSHILISVLSRKLPSGSSVKIDLANSIAIGGHVQATWTAVILLFWIILASVLHRFKIYVRP